MSRMSRGSSLAVLVLLTSIDCCKSLGRLRVTIEFETLHIHVMEESLRHRGSYFHVTHKQAGNVIGTQLCQIEFKLSIGDAVICSSTDSLEIGLDWSEFESMTLELVHGHFGLIDYFPNWVSMRNESGHDTYLYIEGAQRKAVLLVGRVEFKYPAGTKRALEQKCRLHSGFPTVQGCLDETFGNMQLCIPLRIPLKEILYPSEDASSQSFLLSVLSFAIEVFVNKDRECEIVNVVYGTPDMSCFFTPCGGKQPHSPVKKYGFERLEVGRNGVAQNISLHTGRCCYIQLVENVGRSEKVVQKRDESAPTCSEEECPGICVGPYCVCKTTQDPRCQNTFCANNQECQQHAKCITSVTDMRNKCVCDNGYAGENCQTKCSAGCRHGYCHTDVKGGVSCLCHANYEGESCEITTCGDGKLCTNGRCEQDQCTCDPGFVKLECEGKVCKSLSLCLQNGTCASQNVPPNSVCSCSTMNDGMYCFEHCDKKCLFGFCAILDGVPKCRCLPDYYGEMCGLRKENNTPAGEGQQSMNPDKIAIIVTVSLLALCLVFGVTACVFFGSRNRKLERITRALAMA